jgi:hypothetical protein
MRSFRRLVVVSLFAVGSSALVLTLTGSAQTTQDDRLRQAVANLGEQCFAGKAFDRELVAPANAPQRGVTASALRGEIDAAESARRLSAAAARVTPTTAGVDIQGRGAPAQARDLTRISDLEELSSLRDIDRVLYRRAQFELILIGPPTDDGVGLRVDDWKAALRAVSTFGVAGVSIDPTDTPEFMKVRYIGGIEGSHLGLTFFEADRTLKILSTGFDNLDCSRWPLLPNDLLTQLDLIDGEMRSSTNQDRGWHRFWFEPADDAIKEDPAATGVARFEQNRLVVLDESIPPGTHSPSAEQFSSTLSKRFLALTAQMPTFADLQRQAVMVALAKWMVDRSVPADRSWLEDPAHADTPAMTPTITVMRATLLDQGYLRYGIHGGVDFQKPNKYGREAGIRAPITAALQVRPLNSRAWNFRYGGTSYRAVALRIRNPAPMTRRGAPWDRISVRLPQPGIDSLVFPPGYARGLARLVLRNGDTTSVVTVGVNGTTRGTFIIAPGSETSLGVRPGRYELTATARCGTRNDSINVAEGNVDTHSYSCVVR